MIAVSLFAKAPRPGSVKTRLAADIGADEAVRIYRQLGSRVVSQVGPVSSLTVWYDPPDAADEMRAWLGDLCYRPQVSGDLGERLAVAFDDHFAARPNEIAIAIGADAPEVDADVILGAAAALQSADVVIGPATDGGYYLIGLKRPLLCLFGDEIPWGTDRVFGATKRICDGHGIAFETLPVLRDVDRFEDLKALGIDTS